MSRREALAGGWRLCQGALFFSLGCGGDEASPTPTAPGACGGEGGWAALSVDDHPELDAVGGWTPFSDPSLYLDVNVAQVEAGRYVAVWRICPHGACFVEYVPEERSFSCPCHGSRFGEDGALLEGPATRGLASYPACREGSLVWIDAGARGGA